MKLQLAASVVVCSVVCSVVCVSDFNNSWSGSPFAPNRYPNPQAYQHADAEYDQYPGVQSKIISGSGAPNQYPTNGIGGTPGRPGALRPPYPSYPPGYPSNQGYPSQQEYPSSSQGHPSPQGHLSSQYIPPGGFERIVSAISLIAETVEKLEERVRVLEYLRADVDVMKKQLEDLTHNDLSGSESTHINRFGIPSNNISKSASEDQKLTPESPPVAAVTATPVKKKSCPPKFERIGEDCFYISVRNYQMSTWQGAQAMCSALGARLAAPDSTFKLIELNDELTRSSSTAAYNYWLGGLYPGISWRWVFSGEEVAQDPNLWTYSSSHDNAVARQATYFEDQPTLFSIRQKLLDAGRSDDDLVKLMENITAAVGEDKVAEFVANDPASQGVELDLSSSPEESESRRVKDNEKTWFGGLVQHPAESRIEVSPLRNFLNPLLSFFNVGAPKKNTLSSMMDSFRFVMGQTREPKAKPVDGTSTMSVPALSATPTRTPTTALASSPTSGSSPSSATNSVAPSTDSTSFEGTLKSAGGTATPSGRNLPWNKSLGRCLLLQPVVEREKRLFKYAADQCGYRRYFICQKS